MPRDRGAPIPAPRHLPPQLRRTRGPALPVQALQAHLLDTDLPRRPRPAPAIDRLPDLPRPRLEGIAAPDDAQVRLRSRRDRQADGALRQTLPRVPRARAARACGLTPLGGPVPARRARDLRDRPALEAGDGSAARTTAESLHPARSGRHASGPKTAAAEEIEAARADRGGGRQAPQRIAREGQRVLRGAERDHEGGEARARRYRREADLSLHPQEDVW